MAHDLIITASVLDYLREVEEPIALAREARRIDALGQMLADAGLSALLERDGSAEQWRGYGPSGLDGVRTVAGLVARGRPVARGQVVDRLEGSVSFLPPPDDPGVLLRHKVERWLQGDGQSPPAFAHLMCLSEDLCYIVAVDFARPIQGAEGRETGAVVSLPRLIDDLRQVAAALELPPDMRPGDPRLQRALDRMYLPKPTDAAPWERHPVTTDNCFALQTACIYAQKTGVALRLGDPCGVAPSHSDPAAVSRL